MTEGQNVYYMAVARVQGEGIVVASHSNDVEVDENAVCSVIDSPTMQVEPGKHYTFSVGDTQAWHLIGDQLGMIYILIVAPSYKSKPAYMCLEELQRLFMNHVGDRAATAKKSSLTGTCRQILATLTAKYDDLSKVNKLADIARKVETVKAVMQDNIDVSLQNCVKLESIEKQAEELQMQAGVFKKNANELKNKMRCKEIKTKLCLATVVLLLIGGIVGIIYWQTSGKSSSDSSDSKPASG